MPVKKEQFSPHDDDLFLFQEIVHHLPLMVFVKDAKELRFVHMNRVGEQLIGAKKKDLLGKNDFDFFPEEQAEFFIQKDKAVLRGKKLVDIPEEPIDTPKGKRWLHTMKVPILGKDKACKYLLGISEDITEKKKIADTLANAEQRFERTFDNAPIGIALVSPEGAWLRVNKALLTMLGYTKKELLKKTFQDITHPDDLQKDLDLVTKVLEGKIQTYEMEKRYFRKDKSILHVQLNVSLVRDDAGEPLHFVSHIMDITKRKDAEQALEEKILELEQLNDLMIGREEKMIEMKAALKKGSS